jgi:4-amino-4-deoxy-L-arabinose transferase-like glycosyltransferase
MAFLRRVLEPQPVGPSPAQPVGPSPGELSARTGARSGRFADSLTSIRRRPELGPLIAVAALLDLWALGRNGWANVYYSAAVRSMAASWHDFLYASLDRSGVMTVDKPPLSLWVQSLSVRLFGYHPLAILVPQALMGIASVLLVYDLVRRRFGRAGGFVAGLALATTPIAVAMSRDNNPDALLTLLCLAAVWFAVRAFEDGRTRWLVLAGIAVGLGFETKMLVALVVVPGIVLAWLWIAPRGRLAAIRQLLTGGAAMLAVAAAWPLLVLLTPAGDRPWISGTSDNSVLSLTFGYNGLGRVTGQSGGPGGGGGGAFGEATGPLRLLNVALAGQGGWLLGLAVAGAIIVAVACRLRRRDQRSAWLIAVGGTFAVTAALFSLAQGIFHPYYVVLLAPFTAALVGAGVASVFEGKWPVAIAGAAALTLAVVCELDVLHNYTGQLTWLRVVVPMICGGAAGSLFVFPSRRARAWAMSIAAGALMIGPAIWSVDTLGYATNSTFPAGGPQAENAAIGPIGAGGSPRRLFAGGGAGRRPAGLFGGGGQGPVQIPGSPGAGGVFGGGGPGGAVFGQEGPGGGLFGAGSNLTAAEGYARSHGGGTIAVASQQDAAQAIIASDAAVAGIGGFSGQESDPSVAWLAGEVARGQIRWVVSTAIATTGVGARPGASPALDAVAKACTPVASVSSDFYDCGGDASKLRALS